MRDQSIILEIEPYIDRMEATEERAEIEKEKRMTAEALMEEEKEKRMTAEAEAALLRKQLEELMAEK